MSSVAAIETLKDIQRRCLIGEPLSGDQARWLSDCLSKFLSHDCGTVEDAFDLRSERGGVPWWREEAIRVRNMALQEMVDQFFPDMTPHAKAESVWTLSSRYAASAWRHDKNSDAMPAHYEGTPKEYLWRAFKSGAAMPLGKRQLRNVVC